MYGNFSNWSTQRPEFSNSSFQPTNESPVTNPPHNIPRSQPLMTLNLTTESCNSLRNNIRNVVNEIGNLMQSGRSAENHGQDFTSWIRRTSFSGRSTITNTPDSVVITFETTDRPSASCQTEARCSVYQNPAPSNQHNIQASSTGLESNQNQSVVNYTQDNTNVTSSSTVSNGNSRPHTNDVQIPMSQISEVTGAQAANPSVDVSPEVQTFDKHVQKYFPVITFLSAKAMYDHREGILIFVGLLITFIHANSVVKREIAKQNKRSLFSLSMLFVNLFVCICFIYFVFQEQRLYKSLVFIPPYTQPLSIWDLLWMVGITDFVLKFITIQIKVGMACFPGKILPYSTRGKWYLMLERVSQLYRGLAPIQPWLYYLMEAYQGPEKIVGVFFSIAYMVSKGTDLMSKIKLFMKAFWKLLQNVSLGVRPSKEELDTAGSQCPICHDVYNAPILLECKHVFCESCVTTWFDREQTCPLCRAKVADDPSWRDGATSFFTQLF